MSIDEPASVISTLPVHEQVHFESSVSAFCSEIVTADEPGDQGDVTTGTHGCGIRTPSEAAVAAATCGFARVVHSPKGAMFTIGLKSFTVAVGCSSACCPESGSTVKVDGSAPALHTSFAPFVTSLGMLSPNNRQGFDGSGAQLRKRVRDGLGG
jgi:hypothetical protein